MQLGFDLTAQKRKNEHGKKGEEHLSPRFPRGKMTRRMNAGVWKGGNGYQARGPKKKALLETETKRFEVKKEKRLQRKFWSAVAKGQL